MNFFEHILEFFDYEIDPPTNYGLLHILFILLVIGTTLFVSIKYKNTNDKTFRNIVFISWLIMALLEVYKQVIFTFELEDGIPTWSYAWYSFPFQFCSTPLYVLPFIVFLKDGKLRDMIMSFISTFSLFAGITVYVYPNDVFTYTLGVNLQTMIHHGLQIVLGVYLTVYNRNKFNLKYYLKGIPVFAAFVIIAVFLNIGVYHIFMWFGMDNTFNMFFISPYFDCTLPVLSVVMSSSMPYIIKLLIYIIAFSVIAFIVYIIEQLLINLQKKKILND